MAKATTCEITNELAHRSAAAAVAAARKRNGNLAARASAYYAHPLFAPPLRAAH